MDVSKRLLSAVQCGDLKQTQDLLDRYGLSYLPPWSDGHALLRRALKKKHREIAKMLLISGAKVNSTSFTQLPTPLHYSITIGELDIVKMLVERHAEIDARNISGATPMHVAAKLGHLPIVKFLLEHGACIGLKYTTYKDKYTPLHLCVKDGHEEITELLLEHGAPIHAKTKKGETALCIASEMGYLQICKILLDHGANINDTMDNGYTPLHVASEKNRIEVVKMLLNNSADEGNKTGPLQCAVKHKHKELVTIFLKHGADVNAKDETGTSAILYAIKNGDIEITKLLLSNGASVGNNPDMLITAADARCKKIVDILLEHGADVNSKDKTGAPAILYAIKKRDIEITKLLLSNGASVDNNLDLLFTAVDVSCKEIVEILLEHGADINGRDESGRTALHFTVIDYFEIRFGRVITSIVPKKVKAEIADLLIRKGLEVDAQTKDGVTTLHLAIRRGYAEVVETLLKHNADIMSMGKGGMTPLHLSAAEGNEVISKMLLEEGAYVNARCKGSVSHVDGQTPLHMAVDLNKRTVKLLLQCGADVDSLDKNGSSALHVACHKENADILEILLEYGSDINILDKWNRTPFDYAIETASDCEYYNIYGATDIGDEMDDTDTHHRKMLSDSDSDSSPVLEKSFVEKHIVKMVTANLYVNESNLKHINNCNYQDFQILCQQELKCLSTEKVGNSTISFHDVLTMEAHKLAAFVRNEYIVGVLESDDYGKKFPLYASTIRANFRRAIKRRNLMEQGHICFQFFKDCPQIPCTDIILNFLNNDDIRNLIDANFSMGSVP